MSCNLHLQTDLLQPMILRTNKYIELKNTLLCIECSKTRWHIVTDSRCLF